MNWEELAKEKQVWERRNFPRATVMDAILGTIEELGELTHAHLKAHQNIRGNVNQHAEDARDAVGDISIYLMGVMARYDVYPSDWEPSWPDEHVKDGTDCIMRLSYWVGKLALGYCNGKNTPVDGRHCVGPIVYYLKKYVALSPFEIYESYQEIVQTTWDQVKVRDWIKYPTNGRDA